MKTAADTKQYQKLNAALNVVTSALMKASRQSMFSFERIKTVPEADVAALRASIEGALPLLDLHFGDPMRQLPSKLATRLKNFRKLLTTMRDAPNGEALASVFMKLQGRTTDVWRKFIEYRDEALMIVRALDEEHLPVVDIGSYSVQPFNTGRGEWDDEKWSTLTYVLHQGEKLLLTHGMGKYVGGAVLAYPTRTLPPSAGGGGSTLAMYRRTDDIMWIATGGDPRRVLQTFIHETGHRVYWRLMGNRGRATWEEYFKGNTGAPDVDTVVRAWEAWVAAPAKAGVDDWERVKYGRYLAYWIKHLMKSGENDLLMWTEIIADKAGVDEKIDSLTGSPKRNSVPGLDLILAKKNEIQSFLSPVTAYSATSAGELFAEVFAHYIVDGPTRIPPDVRAEFRRALPGIRMGSGSPLSLRPDYGEGDAAVPRGDDPSPCSSRVASRFMRR